MPDPEWGIKPLRNFDRGVGGGANQPAELDQRRLQEVRGLDQLEFLARLLRLEGEDVTRRDQAHVEALPGVADL